MMNVAFGADRGQGVDFLRVLGCAKGREGQNLCLTAGEEPGAVRTRHHIDLAPDRADLGQGAAVGTQVAIQNPGADDTAVSFFKALFIIINFALIVTGERGDGFFLQSLQRVGKFRLGMRGIHQGFHALGVAGAHFINGILIHEEAGNVALRFADGGGHFLLNLNQRLNGFVPEDERLDHILFADLFGAGLNHQNGVGSTRNAQIQVGIFNFLISRVGNELPVDTADADSAHRPVPRNIGNHQGGGSRVDGDDIKRIDVIGGKAVENDLNLVAHVLIEQRAQRTVNQAGGQNDITRGTSFTAEERTRDAPAGVHAFFILNGEGEEILPLFRLRAHGSRGENDRITDSHGDGTARLTGEHTAFKGDGLAVNFGNKLFCVRFHFYPVSIFLTGSGTEKRLTREKQTQKSSFQLPSKMNFRFDLYSMPDRV